MNIPLDLVLIVAIGGSVGFLVGFFVIRPLARRRETTWWGRWDHEHRWDTLGTYNSERARGIPHTAEMDERMAREQEAFNAEMKARR